jgi:hypothetical protein
MSGRGKLTQISSNVYIAASAPHTLRIRFEYATAYVPHTLPQPLRHTEARKSLYLGQAARIDRLDRKAQF